MRLRGLFLGWLAAVAPAAALAAGAGAAVERGGDTVVLVHGLGRGPASMWPLARALRREGYQVRNIGYASQRGEIPVLAAQVFGPVFGPAASAGWVEAGGGGSRNLERGGRVHVVTHSLGGILLRRYLRDHGVPAKLGRVVMLAPPNRGSEIVDTLKSWRIYAWVNGPAGLALGTGEADSPTATGPLPAGVEVGVIAGNFSWNPLFSTLIAGPDDGKVSVASTHVAGEADHRELPYSHTWLMNRREVRRQVAEFLRHGRFARE